MERYRLWEAAEADPHTGQPFGPLLCRHCGTDVSLHGGRCSLRGRIRVARQDRRWKRAERRRLKKADR